MKKIIRTRKKPAGISPGSLIYTGDKKSQDISVSIIQYSENIFEEKTFESVEKIFPLIKTDRLTWINIKGLSSVNALEKIGNQFGIHSLTIEDILNTEQRPKVEDFDDYLFIVARIFFISENELISEQVSLILKENLLLTFVENDTDPFKEILSRLKSGKGKIRKSGSDYLAYACIDAVVDSYFFLLEKLGETIEVLEDQVITSPQTKNVHRIHNLRSEMILLRKSVWPLREVISILQRRDSPLIKKSTEIYLRDVYDHTIQIIETIESLRDIVSGMLDTYLSSLSNRMNEIMKVLTIISTLFIPLTFLVGVYGMNFKTMPELNIRWIYPWGFWIFSFTLIGAMLFYFKKKKWF